jgi:TatD DNase family protein
MTIFDTHAHYDDSRFDGDRDELLSELPQRGVCNVINIGCDVHSSQLSLDMADRYGHVYAAVGIHPQQSGEAEAGDIDRLRQLARHPKAVAIGEIGLDYHYDLAPHEVQIDWFRRQLELAKELNTPVVIHEREAVDDCLKVLRETTGVRGVLHCYSGSWETAKELLKMGYYLSFTGVLTFKNARRALEVVQNMPLERLMVETDAPYMAPEPFRGKRCDSTMIRYMLEKIADLRGITPEEASAITTRNAKRFFGIE